MRILFIGNDTGRTGAPIILLEIAKYFKSRGAECIFVFESDGILTNDYSTIGKCFFWNLNLDGIGNKFHRWLYKALYRIGFKFIYHFNLKKQINSFNPQVIYGNTGVTGYLIKEFYKQNRKSILHLHEMEGILTTHCGPKFTLGLQYIDTFISINEQITNLLVCKYGIDIEHISQIPVFMPYDFSESDYCNIKRRNGKIVIGAAGVPSHRKGTDVFIEVAKRLALRDLHFEFRWVGFDCANPENAQYVNEINRCNLQEVILLIPPTTKPLDAFAEFDLLLLPSREDPNPLVVLESGKMGIPVVCFKHSGATHQIADDGGGIAVEMEDTNALCDAIIELTSNNNLYESASAKIKNIVKLRYDKSRNIEDVYNCVIAQLKS